MQVHTLSKFIELFTFNMCDLTGCKIYLNKKLIIYVTYISDIYVYITVRKLLLSLNKTPEL